MTIVVTNRLGLHHRKRRSNAHPKPLCRRAGCTNMCPRLESSFCSNQCYALSMMKHPDQPRRQPQKKQVARGSAKAPGMLQTMICLDEETFAELRRMAINADTSFSEQVRLMVEWGLEECRSR